MRQKLDILQGLTDKNGNELREGCMELALIETLLDIRDLLLESK